MPEHVHTPECIEYDQSVFNLGRIDICIDYDPESCVVCRHTCCPPYNVPCSSGGPADCCAVVCKHDGCDIDE